ncbi:MAG: hypothetical protein ABIV28_05735, partial [Longimicrobiales bacterium]
LASGTGNISNGTSVTDATGRATFTGLTIDGAAGVYALAFSGAGFTTPSAAPIVVATGICAGAPALILDLPLGDMVRYGTSDAAAPRCLEFDAARNSGQQYLVLFENMPRTGEFTGGLYPTGISASDFTLKVTAVPVVTAPAPTMAGVVLSAKVIGEVGAVTPQDWNFGGGAIYEGTPTAPPPGYAVAAPVNTMRSASASSGLQAALRSADPVIGDTMQMWLEGISRLGLASGMQKAVVRYISDDLVFVDDVRLTTTLTRTNGAFNTPLTTAQMDTIAREYAAKSKVQSDILFQGRHNDATEASTRITVVSTLMYGDNIWGYTYSIGNYFAFDYWVATNGSTRGNNQVLQRVADNLFMHEIAHMRHYGMLQHTLPSRTGVRGNQWVTEGFARFTERLPIAMRLLGTATPSRTSNFVLPVNPIFNSSYFFDDVPTYLDAGSAFFGGYSASSFVFDYLADQVAYRGGNALTAVRDVLSNAGVEADADAAVSRWLPGRTLAQLVTRARIALYADDYPGAALPPWTQYHQYQLRSSRPAVSATSMAKEPRTAWPRVVPGVAFADSVQLLNGTAYGYLVDGTAGTTNTAIGLDPVAGANGVVSITRIR